MISRASIARAFGRAASQYDQHADLQRKVGDELLSIIATEHVAPDMIDLGCGTGYCSHMLRSRFPASQLLALDMALPMLQATRQQRLDSCALLCADVQAIPLHENLFDLVVSNLTIQWCAHYEMLFAELFRIARPGAQLLLSTFGPETLREVKAAWARIDTYVHVNEFVPLSAMIQHAQAAGFSCSFRTEVIQRWYRSMQEVGRELKGLGAYNMNRDQAKGFTSRKALAMAERVFAETATDAGIAVTFEIFYLELKKPNPLQIRVEQVSDCDAV
jgi:malonyl-CoA O-methyltransferase